jgi:hypothetical protein
MDLDHLEKTNLFARAGGQLLPPGKNNSMMTAARTNGSNRSNRSNGTYGGGGGGGVLASSPENIIQMAAELKTDRARRILPGK